MKATELLLREHRLIERVLNALELATDTLQRGGDVPQQFFVDVGECLLGFADGTHHRKEGVVFRAMIAGGAKRGDGAIALLTLEHEEGKAISRAILDSARRMDRDPAAKTAVVSLARSYVTLLRGHIENEDGVVFPMADTLVPGDRHEQVYLDCVAIESPDKYQPIVERLEGDARRFATTEG